MIAENIKVGILTFHRAYNYGAVLQAYALHKALEKVGVDNELVDYYPDRFRQTYTLRNPQSSIEHRIGMALCRILLRRIIKKRNKGFERFIDQEIKKSRDLYRNSQEIKTDRYQGVVTGSDQVWNPSLIDEDKTYFLQGDAFDGIKKYSYAASIGKTNVPDKLRDKIKEFLRDFDMISVRENTAADIIRSIAGKESIVSCDPTILIEGEKWNELCGREPLVSGDYILLYYVREPEYIRCVAKRLSAKLSCPVVCVSCAFSDNFISVYKNLGSYQNQKDGFISKNDASPYEFLNLLKNAKYVVTSSFHGTVFSVLFHKQFLAQTIWRDGTNNIRVTELLHRTGLQLRSANDWKANIDQPIDWGDVDAKVAAIRKKGIRYLELINNGLRGNTPKESELIQCDLGSLPPLNNSIPAIYAVKHKDEMIRAASRSGGVFTALSDYILENAGVVYGCQMTKDYLAEHIRAETKEVRNTMRGSKYIQSYMGDSFRQVKADLTKGCQVLFSGTSCQIAGLRSFLQKNYDNLVCIDILCHGVPSKAVWKKYLEWEEKKNKKAIISVDFRNKKDFGWKAHRETLIFDDNSKLDSVIFKNLFLGDNILRPSCYECRYKSIFHPGDITIGDFWGVDKAVPSFDDDKGVSLVLINTEKGYELFDKIKSDLFYEQSTVKKAMQPAIFAPSLRPEKREQFWMLFQENDFEKIVKKYGSTQNRKWLKKAKRIYHRLRGR